jgi:hypothetical protein
MGKKIDHASVKQQAWFPCQKKNKKTKKQNKTSLVPLWVGAREACKFLLFTPKRQFTVTTAAARAGATRPN